MLSKKVGAVYRHVAIFLFSALLVFVVANLSIYGYQKINEYLSPLSNPISEKYPVQLERVYPGWKENDIKALLHESWNIPLVYEPFTEFREKKVSGKYVNVSPQGFRIGKDQGSWPPSAENFNVFVFGGSTTFGYGLPDDQTIPSFLQDALQQKMPSQKVRVYNFGRGNYYSTHERILFEQLILSGFVPNLAVFIDGMNENLNIDPGSVFSSEIAGFMEGGFWWQARRLTSRLPLVRKLSDKVHVAKMEKNTGSPKSPV